MGLGTEIGRMFQHYVTSRIHPDSDIAARFDDMTATMSTDDLSQGISEAFRSGQTPSLGNVVGQLFEHANSGERAGMLSHLLEGVPPSAIASMLGDDAASSSIGNLLGTQENNEQITVSEQAASQLSETQVEELTQRAQLENPGIVEHMSRFFAENPALLKTLGGTVLAVILGKVTQRH